LFATEKKAEKDQNQEPASNDNNDEALTDHQQEIPAV
jgi:hypothetical protein